MVIFSGKSRTLSDSIMDITNWVIHKPDTNNNTFEPVHESGNTDSHETESKKLKLDTGCGARDGDDI